jgi:hypothetical protein
MTASAALRRRRTGKNIECARTSSVVDERGSAIFPPSCNGEEQNWEPWLVFFLKTMANQNDAAKVKEEHSLRASLPALSRQILGLVNTRSEITVKEIEDSTGPIATPSKCT